MNRVLIAALIGSITVWALALWGALSIIDFIRRGWMA